ncbi:MAG: hypothetical protein ACR2OU_21795 [Thermomicrobiales bacterium]
MSQATAAPSGTATTSAETSLDYPDLAAYSGVKQAVVRTYMADFDAIQANAAASPASTPVSATPAGATPEDGAVAPEFDNLGMMLIIGTVIEFDTATSAETSFPGLAQEIEKNAQTEIGSDSSKFEPVTVDGVGQESKAFSLKVAADSFGSEGFLIVARQENVIFSIYGMSLHGAASTATTTFATKLVSGTIGSDAPKPELDGMSTGGIWDVFPPKGDASLGGLVPLDDGQIYPNPAVKP